MNRTRILLVDDHSMVREGFRLLLESQPDFVVVGEGSDGRSAIDRTKELNPDVVLMDITMPGLTGLDATRVIKECCPDVQILAVTGDEDETNFFQIIEAGASGYVLKGSSAMELISAVRVVAGGDVFLQPDMARRLATDYLRRVRSGNHRDRFDSLTQRELEVLQLVARGYTNQEIASRLVLSPSTVQTHRMHCMEKLGLRTRAELIKYALDKGLLESGR